MSSEINYPRIHDLQKELKEVIMWEKVRVNKSVATIATLERVNQLLQEIKQGYIPENIQNEIDKWS